MPQPPRPPAYRPSPNARWLWLVAGVLQSMFLLAAGGLLWFVIPSDAMLLWRIVSYAALPLALLASVALCWAQPVLRWRTHRWEVTDLAVYTLTGWLTRTWTMVPISRIQTVDVAHGPMQRIFGLGSVAVRTASAQGTILVPDLPGDVATEVAADLAARADAVRDDVT